MPESTNASDSIEPFVSTTLEEINHEYNVVVPLEEVGEMVGDVSLDDKHTSDEVAQEGDDKQCESIEHSFDDNVPLTKIINQNKNFMRVLIAIEMSYLL